MNTLQHTIGVKILRLSAIYESDNLIAPNTRNYTEVNSILGVQNDLHLLSVLLHQRNMHLILDLPLTSAHPKLYHPNNINEGNNGKEINDNSLCIII